MSWADKYAISISQYSSNKQTDVNEIRRPILKKEILIKTFKNRVMKKIIFAVLLMVGTLSINAQSGGREVVKEVKAGDIFQIGRPDAPNFKHIDFPRANTIIKNGGIANYKKMEGVKVVVTAVKERKDGTLQVKIKRTDGGRFFGLHTVVSAALRDALESGELRGI